MSSTTGRYANDLLIATTAARAAGALALQYFQAPCKQWEKSANNPVCEADIKADALIMDIIQEAHPNDGWLSEETADNPERLKKDRVWIVDPIDGTRAFLNGTDDWGISIALAEAGTIVAAAFYCPLQKEIFTATKDGGAYLNDRPITPSANRNSQTMRMEGNPRAFKDNRYWPVPWPEEMELTVHNSVALRMVHVACGRADACVSVNPKNEWDVAAADLILREAGATIHDGYGKDYLYNRPTILSAHVVCSTPELMPTVMRHVTPALEKIQA